MVLCALTPFVMKSAEAEPEVHIATRLGNPVTRFADPLKSPADLQAMLRSETLRADVDFIARESGFKGEMEDLRRAAEPTIAETWTVFDTAGMLRQIGAVPGGSA